LPGPRLILASASPRRQQLLRDAGYDFEVDIADVNEDVFPPGMLPAQVALYLAEAKAKAVAQRHVDNVVLAADTIVALGDTMLGKPIDANHARRMMHYLSGAVHIVITGVCIMNLTDNLLKSTRVMSAAKMKLLTPEEIERYVASNLWQGKAGGYGIQDPGTFVTRQAGSETNIIGLPMEATTKLLAEAGIIPAR